jgi:hypothetical protein
MHAPGPPPSLPSFPDTANFQSTVESAVADRFSALLEAINNGLSPSGQATSQPVRTERSAEIPHVEYAQPRPSTLSPPAPHVVPEVSRQDVQELQQGQQRMLDEVKDFYARWDSRPEMRGLRELSERLEELTNLVQANQFTPSPLPGGQAVVPEDPTTDTLTHSNSSQPATHGDDAPARVTEQPVIEPDDLTPQFAPLRIVLLTPSVARDDDEPLELWRDWKSPGGENSDAEWNGMVQQRDEYIAWLGGQIASIATKINDWMEYFAKQQFSEDAAEKIKQARHMLLAEHRTHQVKLSVERGRLFREQSSLQQKMTNFSSARAELEARRQECMSALKELQENGTTNPAVVGRLTRFFKRRE